VVLAERARHVALLCLRPRARVLVARGPAAAGDDEQVGRLVGVRPRKDAVDADPRPVACGHPLALVESDVSDGPVAR